MRNATRARCIDTVFDELECALPFEHDIDLAICLIARWKAAVPARFRRFDGDAKVWRFRSDFRGIALDLLLRAYPDSEYPAHYRRQRERIQHHWPAITLRYCISCRQPRRN